METKKNEKLKDLPIAHSMGKEGKRGTREAPFSQKTWVPQEGDTLPTETLVVQYGYVPMKAQIERMIQAGKELDVFRKEYYDFGDEREIPAEFEDPTVDKNFDPAEAYAYMRILAKKVKAREKALKNAQPPEVKPVSTPESNPAPVSK